MAKPVDEGLNQAPNTSDQQKSGWDDFKDPQFCPSMLACPKCKKANMEMNSLMNLVCPNCGYTSGGGST